MVTDRVGYKKDCGFFLGVASVCYGDSSVGGLTGVEIVGSFVFIWLLVFFFRVWLYIDYFFRVLCYRWNVCII